MTISSFLCVLASLAFLATDSTLIKAEGLIIFELEELVKKAAKQKDQKTVKQTGSRFAQLSIDNYESKNALSDSKWDAIDAFLVAAADSEKFKIAAKSLENLVSAQAELVQSQNIVSTVLKQMMDTDQVRHIDDKTIKGIVGELKQNHKEQMENLKSQEALKTSLF